MHLFAESECKHAPTVIIGTPCDVRCIPSFKKNSLSLLITTLL